MSNILKQLIHRDYAALREPVTRVERFHFHALPWRPALLLACVILGMGYLLLVNQSAVNGFALKDLEDRMAQLEESNRRLELTATQLRSMETLAQVGNSLGLEPVAQARYLGPTGAVAAR